MATSIIRRIRPLLEPTRSWNHRARALPGWWRSHSQASSIAVRLARGLPDLAMPWSRRTAPLMHRANQGSSGPGSKCAGDLVAWIDERLAEADVPGAAPRAAHMRQALLQPLGTVHGLGPKVLTMTLADFLLG